MPRQSKYLQDVSWNSTRIYKKRVKMEQNCINFIGNPTQFQKERFVYSVDEMAKSLTMKPCDINVRKKDKIKLDIELSDKINHASYDLEKNKLSVPVDTSDGRIVRAWATAFNTYWGNHIDKERQRIDLSKDIKEFKNSTNYELYSLRRSVNSYNKFIKKGIRNEEDFRNRKFTLWESPPPIRFDNTRYEQWVKFKCPNQYSEKEMSAKKFKQYLENGWALCPQRKNFIEDSLNVFNKRMSNSLESTNIEYIRSKPFVETIESIVDNSVGDRYLTPKTIDDKGNTVSSKYYSEKGLKEIRPKVKNLLNNI